jgi:hypothetical protein
MEAGLTEHRWTMRELMRYQVPLPARVAPKRWGRPPSEHFNRLWQRQHDHG